MIGVNLNLRILLIVCICGVKHSHIIAIFVKQHRHDPQGLILFILQALLRPFVDVFHRIVIAAHQRRYPKICICTGGDHIGICGKSRELFLELWFFLEEVWQEFSHSPVQHDHDYIFAILTHGIAGRPRSAFHNLFHAGYLLIDFYRVSGDHDCCRQNNYRHKPQRKSIQLPINDV